MTIPQHILEANLDEIKETIFEGKVAISKPTKDIPAAQKAGGTKMGESKIIQTADGTIVVTGLDAKDVAKRIKAKHGGQIVESSVLEAKPDPSLVRKIASHPAFKSAVWGSGKKKGKPVKLSSRDAVEIAEMVGAGLDIPEAIRRYVR